MPMFVNYYQCESCGQKWTDLWSATCDDDCPHCGARHMSPYKSEDATGPTDTAQPDPLAALKIAREHIERQREDYETGLEDGTYEDREGYAQLCADLAVIDDVIEAFER